MTKKYGYALSELNAQHLQYDQSFSPKQMCEIFHPAMF